MEPHGGMSVITLSIQYFLTIFFISNSQNLCFYAVPFDQERAHTSVSCCYVKHVHCLEQSQHLLMRPDLNSVVARLERAKRLMFEEEDLKHLGLSRAKLLTTYCDHKKNPPFSFKHISALFLC